MNELLLPLLQCPKTQLPLQLESIQEVDDEIESGWLISHDGIHRYPIRDGVPRFVPESNYADNFGMQWNRFSKTQLDSHSGHSISADRFWAATGWIAEDLKDQWVLDVGCGAGRFAEVALGAGAHVVALDYSSAVDACYENLKHHPNLHVVQGDIYELPLCPSSFAFVYSLGVLQHTPNVAEAFAALPPMVSANGRICVDYYEKSLKSILLPKYWLRPVTKRIPEAKLFAMLQRLVPPLLYINRLVARIPLIGNVLRKLVPVANYDGILPLSENQLFEWALLDTFDWLSPEYDSPQTASVVRKWLEQEGMSDIEVLKSGHLVGRGVKLP